MPIRMALNVAYALLVEGADDKQRKELDDQLYGWGEMNERANRDLMNRRGGES